MFDKMHTVLTVAENKLMYSHYTIRVCNTRVNTTSQRRTCAIATVKDMRVILI